MKKGTWIGILFACACILGLGALAVYLTTQVQSEIKATDAEHTAAKAEAALHALYEPASEALPETEAETEAPLFVIWVGDSRTLGMKEALKNDDLYIGAAGEGYNWLTENGLPLVKDAIRDYPDAPLVINFGVNDYDNLENYMKLYRELTEEFSETHFYFLSVNPIDPEVCTNITNEEISDFNQHLKDAYGDTYLDSYTLLLANDRVPFDGIHYEAEDYRLIYEFVVENIKRKESGGH